jgi:hypothetical protein
MAAKSKTQPSDEPFAAGAVEALDTFGAAISEAGEKSRAMIAGGLDTWTREMQRFQDEMVAQGGATLEQLKACRSPAPRPIWRRGFGSRRPSPRCPAA